jgi:anti-anti-sigma regulatory factor
METRGRMQIIERDGVMSLSGAIDEAAGLTELVSRARDQRVVLDLAGVTFINSLGVRDWIRMQQAFTERRVEVALRAVSEPLVHQLNMIVATRGTARVLSFFAPYACDTCGREDSLLVDAVAHAAALSRLEAPPQTCAECGGVMAFNDFPERYFSFLAQE